MTTKNIINGWINYTYYYVVKLFLVIWLIGGIIAMWNDDSHPFVFVYWLICISLASIVFDSYVIPIEEKTDGIVVHHFWRQSKLRYSRIKKVYLTEITEFFSPFQGTRIAVVIFKKRSMPKVFMVDDVNKLEPQLHKHGLVA